MERSYTDKQGYIKKGLTIVHIGDDVWKIGKLKMVNGVSSLPQNHLPYFYDFESNLKAEQTNYLFNWIFDGEVKTFHRVVYGPNKKEYHLYGKDAIITYNSDRDNEGSYPNRPACAEKSKIYILTHILDKKENWEFDLTKIPQTKKIKVIYSNGTVKNLTDFKGIFEPIEIEKYSSRNKKILETFSKDLIVHKKIDKVNGYYIYPQYYEIYNPLQDKNRTYTYTIYPIGYRKF